jgi:aspartyl/glutamyl-tRNA(Asn/Gln) amidotransferase C subunit
MSTVITPQDVKKVASLSRLFHDADSKIIDGYQYNMDAVLRYADQLSNIDVTGFSPHQSIATIGINDLRDDENDQDTVTYQRVRSNILNNFPARQGDLLELPVRIVEES